MRDDLLDAQACVEWAESQRDVLKSRINEWINSRPHGVKEREDPESGNKTWQIGEINPIPRTINVEVGAIINALRSSLDLLANVLSERNGHVGKRDVYFPVSRTAKQFQADGRKKIARLSTADRAAIEGLQPYQEGNKNLLFALHDMDIARKHRGLIEAVSRAGRFSVRQFGARPEFGKIIRSQAPEHGYVEARGVANPNYQIDVKIEVVFRNVDAIPSEEVIATLCDFAILARGIISRFDTP